MGRGVYIGTENTDATDHDQDARSPAELRSGKEKLSD